MAGREGSFFARAGSCEVSLFPAPVFTSGAKPEMRSFSRSKVSEVLDSSCGSEKRRRPDPLFASCATLMHVSCSARICSTLPGFRSGVVVADESPSLSSKLAGLRCLSSMMLKEGWLVA